MAGEMFGAPAGIRAGQADEQSLAMNKLAMAKTAGDIAMQPDHARLLAAQAGTAEYGLKSAIDIDNIAKRIAAEGQPRAADSTLSKDPVLGPMSSALDNTMRMSEGLIQGGHAQAGIDMMNKASTVISHLSTAARARTLQGLDIARTEAASIGRGASLLGAVTDEASYALAKDAWKSDPLMQGHPFPFGDMSYEQAKDRIPMVVRSAISADQQARLDTNKLAEQHRETARRNEENFKQFRKNIMERNTKLNEARAGRLSTVGGKAVGTPAKAEVDQALLLVGKDYKDMDAVEKYSLAFDAASQARALRANNRGLSASEALYQGYTAARANVLPGASKTVMGIEYGKESPKYTGGGKTPSAALSLPKSGNASDLIVGKYYQSGDVVKQWTASGWKDAGAASGGSYAPSIGDSADDDEEE